MNYKQIEKRLLKHQEGLINLQSILSQYFKKASEEDLQLCRRKMKLVHESLRSDLIMSVPFSERHTISPQERAYADAIQFVCTKINFSPTSDPSIIWMNFLEKSIKILDSCLTQLRRR